MSAKFAHEARVTTRLRLRNRRTRAAGPSRGHMIISFSNSATEFKTLGETKNGAFARTSPAVRIRTSLGQPARLNFGELVLVCRAGERSISHHTAVWSGSAGARCGQPEPFAD